MPTTRRPSPRTLPNALARRAAIGFQSEATSGSDAAGLESVSRSRLVLFDAQARVVEVMFVPGGTRQKGKGPSPTPPRPSERHFPE